MQQSYDQHANTLPDITIGNPETKQWDQYGALFDTGRTTNGHVRVPTSFP